MQAERESGAARSSFCTLHLALLRQFELDRQAIICQFDAVRQARIGGHVRKIVADMREQRSRRPQPLHHLERFGDTEVRGVPAMAEGVDHEHGHAVE